MLLAQELQHGPHLASLFGVKDPRHSNTFPSDALVTSSFALLVVYNGLQPNSDGLHLYSSFLLLVAMPL